jgi:hypothetical protein
MLFYAIGPILAAVALLAYVVWVIAKAIRNRRSDPAAYKQEVESRRDSRKATPWKYTP